LNKFSDPVEPNLIYEKYDIAKKRKIILIPARICKEKGQHVVVKAIPEILKITKNLHFIFIGNSQPGQEEYLQSLKNFAIQNNVENHITWIDFSSDMAQFYKSSFAVLLPSFLEGTPRILLEALSVGVPVIGSSIDGINEIIEPGQNGYKFDLNNPHTLIQAFSTLNSLTENQYTQMKIVCRKIAEDKYNIQRMIAEYEQLYERVLQNPYENQDK
jgi:glycosyltransferase involved in cell wall biosynthesis